MERSELEEIMRLTVLSVYVFVCLSVCVYELEDMQFMHSNERLLICYFFQYDSLFLWNV